MLGAVIQTMAFHLLCITGAFMGCSPNCPHITNNSRPVQCKWGVFRLIYTQAVV